MDKLSADYANDANLPWVLYLVGQRYDYGRMYDDAKQVYEQIAALAKAVTLGKGGKFSNLWIFVLTGGGGML